jgi:Flagellar biosynthesis/type III secretory pathway protein
MSHADSVREIVIESDNKVERGGCIIESDLGNIDARLSTQFELIEEALLSIFKK